MMNGLIQRIDETDLEYQRRLSNIFVAQDKLIRTLLEQNKLLRESKIDRTSFDLSADTPALCRPQIG